MKNLLILLFAMMILASGKGWSQYMPEGYENIRLGMTREAVKLARQNATGLTLGPDPYIEGPSSALTESSSTNLTQEAVWYTFKDTYLNTISLIYEDSGDGTEIIGNNLKILGNKYSIEPIARSDNGAVKWVMPNEIHIIISLPLTWNGERSTLSYMIMDASFAKKIEQGQAKELEERGHDEAAFEVFKARVAAFAKETLAGTEDNEVVSLTTGSEESADPSAADILPPTPNVTTELPGPDTDANATTRNHWLWLGLLCLFLFLIAILLRLTRR